jgi:hypothetical protein
MIEVLIPLASSIVSALVAGGLVLLANRQQARIAAVRYAAERDDRALERAEERAQALRQEQLAPYRALRCAVADFVGAASGFGATADGTDLAEHHRRVIAIHAQCYDEEIRHLALGFIEMAGAFGRAHDDQVRAEMVGGLILKSHDLAEAIDRIHVGGRLYLIESKGRVVPAHRNEFP